MISLLRLSLKPFNLSFSSRMFALFSFLEMVIVVIAGICYTEGKND